MTESLINSRWVPPSLYRTKNVAKYEAATGRLIWWREFSMGVSDLVPLEIVPIRGTEDIAVRMRGEVDNEFGGVDDTDFLFRFHACGSRCDTWEISSVDYPPFGVHAWLVFSQYPQSSLFAGANGTTYMHGVGYGSFPELTPQPYARGFSTDGVPNFGVSLDGPMKGVPGSSDVFLRGPLTAELVGPGDPLILMPTRYTYRVGPGSAVVVSRPFFHFTTPICANAAGHVLYSFNSVRPFGQGMADARGAIVSNHSGANVAYGDYEYAFFVVVGPSSVSLLDNSIVASRYAEYLPGDPDICVPLFGCSHADRWYVYGTVVSDDSNIRCYSSTLSEVWRVTLSGLDITQMLADDDGIYIVGTCTIDGNSCTLVKLDHDGNIIYGLWSAPAVSACLSDDGKYLYTTG